MLIDISIPEHYQKSKDFCGIPTNEEEFFDKIKEHQIFKPDFDKCSPNTPRL